MLRIGWELGLQQAELQRRQWYVPQPPPSMSISHLLTLRLSPSYPPYPRHRTLPTSLITLPIKLGPIRSRCHVLF